MDLQVLASQQCQQGANHGAKTGVPEPWGQDWGDVAEGELSAQHGRMCQYPNRLGLDYHAAVEGGRNLKQASCTCHGQTPRGPASSNNHKQPSGNQQDYQARPTVQ